MATKNKKQNKVIVEVKIMIWPEIVKSHENTTPAQKKVEVTK